MIPSTPPHDEATRRLHRLIGLGCGLLFGLASGLTLWGYDAWALARSSAALAWAKLEIGLPLLVLIGALTGALAGRSTRAGVWVRAWTVSGALAGVVVGQMPFAGCNLATWIAERRLWGANVYPLDPLSVKRMTFVAIVTACTWSAAGLASHLLVEKAQGAASRTGRLRGRSWAALLVCLPLALPAGLLGDDLVNRPLRAGQQAVHETLSSIGAGGGTSSGGVNPYRDLFSSSADYTLHLVGYDLGRPAQATVDVAFDNGLVVRCQTSSGPTTGCLRRCGVLNDCSPLLPGFEAWMDGLIQETLQGGPGEVGQAFQPVEVGQAFQPVEVGQAFQPVEVGQAFQPVEVGQAFQPVAPQPVRVSVSAAARSWLASQRDSLGERYAISRDAQHGGWVIVSARFETGYVLTCYFQGIAPIVVERCSGNQETPG